MINYAYENLFKQTSIPKQLKIYYGNSVLTNDELEYEKFEMQEYLCAKEQLQFGLGASVCVKFSVGYGVDALEGEEIEITITPQGGTELSLGTFYVTSDKPTADRMHRSIVAYDFIGTVLNLNVIDWYNTLFPDLTTTKTVKQIRDSLFTYLNITQETVTLPRDNVTIKKTVAGDELTVEKVLNAICEMNFRLGYMTRDNKFRYVELKPFGETLYPAEDLYPSEDLYPMEGDVEAEVGGNGNYISATFEDYYTAPIDKFQIRTEENDIGYIEGTGTNAYIIENNFLLYGKTTSELQSYFAGALDYLEQICFIPANIQAQGNPCLEVGDRIRLHTRYATIETYILQRNLSGIQGLRDNYISESPRLRSEQLNSVNHSLLALSGKTNALNRTIEETRIEVSDLEVGLTEVTIKADGLEIQVEDIERQIEGETLFFERESGAPTLTNYPAYDFTKSIPCDGTMQLGDGLPFLYTTGYNTYDEHRRDLCVDLSTGEGYRFLLENGSYEWKAIGGSDWSVLYNQISELRQDVDSIDLEVSNTEVTVANHETRITQNTANINIQSTQIEQKVSKNNIISEINQSAEAVSINAGKINLNGAVTTNNNVVIGVDGKITAKGASIASGSGSQNVSINGGQLTTYNANGLSGVRIIDSQIDLFSYAWGSQTWVGSINTYCNSPIKKMGIYAKQYEQLVLGFTADPQDEGERVVLIGNAQAGGGFDGSNKDILIDELKVRALHIGGNENTDSVGLLEGYEQNNYDYVTLRGKDYFLVMLGNNVLKMSVTANEGQLIGTWYGTLSSGSDKRIKDDITDLSQDFISAIGNVQVKEFVYINERYGRTDRKSVGAIAQEVVQALEEQKINPKDYGIVSTFTDEHGNEYYALNYTEFLVTRNAYLEKRVDDLEQRIERLEKLLKGE